MNKVYLNNRQNPIILENTPFASGGEGDIFRIVSPNKYRGYVVKIYHPEKRTREKESKVRFLLNNPPEIMNNNGHSSVVWVSGIIYSDKGFVGLMMPFAKGDKLVILCSAKIPKKYRNKWARFSLKSPKAMELRLKACFNIAAAVFQIHQTGQYVLVDLKPDNVLIQPNGLVSIVDIDSMEIIQGDRVLFPAAVTTPEFAPPEFHKDVQPGKAPIYNTWDMYSMAIIFYKMLFGIHPFAGSAKPPYDKLNALHEKIEHGLFVHSPEKKGVFQVVPPPHRRFFQSANGIQQLFLRCFTDGHSVGTRRPTANDWCSVISGKTLVQVNRPLPSRVLGLNEIAYSKPRPLPIPSTQAINTTIVPKVAPLPPATFNRNTTAETFTVIGLGIVAFFITKSFFLPMILAFIITSIAYNFRKEVAQKRLSNKNQKALVYDIYSQEALVADLKRGVSKYNLSFKDEIQQLSNQQFTLLQNEYREINDLKSSFYQWTSSKDKMLIELEEQEQAEIEALKKQFPELKEATETKKTNDSIDVTSMKDKMNRLTEVLREIEDLQQLNTVALLFVNNKQLVQKSYLLDIAHEVDKIKKTEGAAIKRNETTFDVRIAKEQRLLSSATKTEIRNIQQIVNDLHREKDTQSIIIRMEYQSKKEEVLNKFKSILDFEAKEINEKILELKKEVGILQKPTHSKKIVAAFEELKQKIEKKYDKEYQTILEEGEKRKEEFERLIKSQTIDTEQQTAQLFSKSVIPFNAGRQFETYEREADRLMHMKKQNALIKAEIESYQDVNFWKYMELIMTRK